MLLNEFLKEHRTVQELREIVQKQQATIAKQHDTSIQQQKQLEALISGLQEVTAQVKVNQ